MSKLNFAVIAHDEKKADMVAFIMNDFNIVELHTLFSQIEDRVY